MTQVNHGRPWLKVAHSVKLQLQNKIYEILYAKDKSLKGIIYHDGLNGPVVKKLFV